MTEFYKKEGDDWKLWTLPLAAFVIPMKLRINTSEQIIYKNEQENILSLLVMLITGKVALAQSTDLEKEIRELSIHKWQWMADKDADKLEAFS
ncbi:hypothetical protein Q2T40_02245 [Winogradskyella maritima]|nr:hypothetical protein [Winogradskyella maritima]